MINVIAVITAKTGVRDTVLAACRANVPAGDMLASRVIHILQPA